MNVYTPARYDERVFHLALGIEPLDSTSGQPLTSTVDVRPEEFPRPVDMWRAWRPGETLTGVLPRMHRHYSGRFVRRYDEGVPATVDLRIVDDRRAGKMRVSGEGRTIVPRRVRVNVTAENVVVNAEEDPALDPIPIWQRTFPVACFPGADANLASGITAIRGRAVRQNAEGVLVPVRWVRVRARNVDMDIIGWAHGDDRGEFLLVVEQSLNAITMPDDPLVVTLTVGATLPPLEPDPADPLLAEVDPLWDLPVEVLNPSPNPDTEPSITGRSFLPEHALFNPVIPPIELPHGRETSITIRIA